MSRTPDKNDITGLKINKIERSQRVYTQHKGLQSERKKKDNLKTPLMLVLVLKKKIGTKVQHAFMKINLYKNKTNIQKIIMRYISSILKYKIKINQIISVQKLKTNVKRSKNIKNFASLLTLFINNKNRLVKNLAFLSIAYNTKNIIQEPKQQQPKYQLPPKPLTKDSKLVSSIKKIQQPNRSLDFGNKSLSSSKLNSVKKIEFLKQQDTTIDVAKIIRQNQELKLMELSEQFRQVLKKVQRFDRFFYAHQTQKICKQPLIAEIKRLQKIKNAQKQMRGQFYDNQLSIIALFNHIKLISQMNRDIGDLSKYKQKFQQEQAKKKQQQFRINLQNKRNKNKANNEAQVKQLIESIQANLTKKDYEKVRLQLNTLINKYQKEQIIKDRLILYRALQESLSNSKQLQKNLDQVAKINATIAGYDFIQADNNIKLLKNLQKDITVIVNKYVKQEDGNQKVKSIFSCLQNFSNNLILFNQTKVSTQKGKTIPQKVKNQERSVDDPLKRIKQLQKQIQSYKITVCQLQQIRVQYQNVNKSSNQLQKKIKMIVEKMENKGDVKKDVQNLKKDKLFCNSKHLGFIFSLEQIYIHQNQQKIYTNILSLNNLITSLIQTHNKDKIKNQAKLKQISSNLQNFANKNQPYVQFVQNLQVLLTLNSKITQPPQQKQTNQSKGKVLNKINQQTEPDKKSVVKKINQKQIYQKGVTDLNNQIQKQKQQKINLQKQINILKQNYKNFQIIEKKVSQVIQKIKKNEEWVNDIQILSKEKSLSSNKQLKLFMSFYLTISDYIKKTKTNPTKLQKLLGLVIKIIQKKNTLIEKPNGNTKLSEIQKLFEQAILTDSSLGQFYKILLGWIKNILTLIDQLNQQTGKQYEKETKKLIDGIQTQRNRTKTLNQKITDLQKNNRDQAQTITSLQKLRTVIKQKQKQKRQPQLIKKPFSSKSQELTKLQKSEIGSSLQIQLKQSKQKVLALQKQLNSLKNGKKQRQVSGKKQQPGQQNKNLLDQIKKLQEDIRKLQEQLKVKKQKQNLQKSQKNRQTTFKTQTSKSIASITTLLESRNYKQLQNQANKIYKIYEKDQRFSNVSALIYQLVKIIIQKDSLDLVQKKQIQTISQSQNKDKQKIQLISKLIKQCEPEIKSGAYLTNTEFLDKFLVGADQRSAVLLRDLIRILKTITFQLKNKNQKLEDFQTKYKTQTPSTNNVIQVIKSVESQINKKQYFKNDQVWITLENNLETQDRIIKAIFRVIKRLSQSSRTKLSEQRKQIQKTIRSYESQLQKMNNFISQYDIKLKEKEREYQQLYKSYTEVQRQSVNQDQKKVLSLRGSRKSVRSSYSDKDQMKNIKASIQVLAQQQKNMLQKLQMAENQKIVLVQRLNYLQHELNQSFKANEDLKTTITSIQKNIFDQHENYQRQYNIWRQRAAQYNKQISDLQIKYQKQYQKRQSKLVEQYQNISKQRELALEKYHRDLTTIQNQLNTEINHLRQQLRVKNIEVLQVEQLQILRINHSKLQFEYNILINKINVLEPKAQSYDNVNIQLQYSLKQNKQLQQKISNLHHSNKNFEFQLQNIKSSLELSKQQQLKLLQNINNLENYIKNIRVTPTTSTSNISAANHQKIAEFEMQINRLRTYQNQIINNQINIALKNQQQDFNRFLTKHDQEIEAHFFNIIIPQKIRQVQAKINKSTHHVLDNLNIQEKIKKLEQNLSELNRKYNQQLQANRIMRTQLSSCRTLQSSLREDLRKKQLDWQSKYKQQIIQNQQKISQLIKQRSSQRPTKSLDQYKLLQSQLQQLSQKYNQTITLYQIKIQQIGNQKIIQTSTLTNQLNLLKQKNIDLFHRLQQKQKQITYMNEVFHKDILNIQNQLNHKYTQQITYYEQRIQQYTNQITTTRTNYQNSINTFNHYQCQRNYHQLQSRNSKQINELKNKLNDMLVSKNKQIGQLREIIDRNKEQYRDIQNKLSKERESRDLVQRQRQQYIGQLTAIIQQKNTQIYKIHTQYEHKLSNIIVQKTTLQPKLNQNPLKNSSRNLDTNHYIKILQLQSQLANKTKQIKHLQQINQHRKKQYEEIHEIYINCVNQRDNLRIQVNNMQNHIMRLQADISYFNNELHKYKMTLMEIQGRQALLQNDLIRIKTQSDQDDNTLLHQQIAHLKQQIIRITTKNVQKIHHIQVDQYDPQKLKRMINQMQIQRNSERYGYDQTQLQILKKINVEVSELVATNRHLQTKCNILQSQKLNDGKFGQNVNFVILMQDRIEQLVTFLVQKNLIDSAENYNKYLYHTKQILSLQNFQEYFTNWLNFIKSLFILSNDIKIQQLRLKAQEMIQLKQQMNRILDKHIEYVEDQNYQALDKYKMIFSDIKILLREFMKNGNQEYIQMIWRCLEPEHQNMELMHLNS